MTSYVIRRLLLMVPTVIGILTVTFVIIQLVPGGPLEQMKQMLENATGAGGLEAGGAMKPRGGDAIGRRGLSTQDYENLRKVYHLDRPLVERYLRTFVWFSRRDAAVPYPQALFRWENWDGMLLLKFGDSFYRNRNVLELIMDKMPVSLSLGFWSFILTYPACIALGVAKAVREGTRFDAASSALILVGYSIPGFVLAVLLVVLLGPGDAAWAHLVPLSGLTSAGTYGYETWSLGHKIVDYLQHVAAPVFCLSIGSFAVLSILTKNAVLEEIGKQYVTTARAKGLSERRVLFRHILRNSLIPLVTGFPSRFVAIFFTGSLLIERIFNLDGIGLLGYTAVIQRDYPVVMGDLFVMTLIGLGMQLVTDLCYVLVDPRISFESAA